MSARAVKWAAKQETGGSARKCVLLFLAHIADRKGEATYTNRAAGNACELAADTIRAYVADLEKAGLVARLCCEGGPPTGNRIVIKFKKAQRSLPAAAEISATVAAHEWGRA